MKALEDQIAEAAAAGAKAALTKVLGDMTREGVGPLLCNAEGAAQVLGCSRRRVDELIADGNAADRRRPGAWPVRDPQAPRRVRRPAHPRRAASDPQAAARCRMTCGNSVCAADPDRHPDAVIACGVRFSAVGGAVLACTGCRRPKVDPSPGEVAPVPGGPGASSSADDVRPAPGRTDGDGPSQAGGIDLVGTDPHVSGGTAVPTSPPG